MATHQSRLASSLFDRFAGKTYRHTESGRKFTVYGIQSSPHIAVLLKRRKNQLVPDEWSARDWLMWVSGAKRVDLRPRIVRRGDRTRFVKIT